MKGLTGILAVAFDVVDLFLPPPRDPRKELTHAALIVGAGMLFLTAFGFALAAALYGLMIPLSIPVACLLTAGIALLIGLGVIVVAKSISTRGRRRSSASLSRRR
jgi:hypothetical protein